MVATGRSRFGQRQDMTQGSSSEPDWNAIRADYEGTEATVADICASHGVARAQFYRMRAASAWRLRKSHAPKDRPAIIARMFRVFERQLENLEGDMKTTGEKEAAILGKLASTLEKLIEIDNTEGRKPQQKQSRDIETLRAKLAERIDQLTRR